jgi:sec-independent protein translocase protein TatA
MGPSIWQILIVIVVIMLLFGANRFPRIMEDLAKGIKAFKSGLKDEDSTKSIEKDKSRSSEE